MKLQKKVVGGMCVREKKTTRSSCINMYFVEYCAVTLETLITLKFKLDVKLDVQTGFQFGIFNHTELKSTLEFYLDVQTGFQFGRPVEFCLDIQTGFQFGHPHGTRTCIKRKKIHYGNFFDFCAEKCIQNQIPRDQNPPMKGF